MSVKIIATDDGNAFWFGHGLGFVVHAVSMAEMGAEIKW